MNGIVFLPDRNTKRADYSGAFLPEARRFAEVHSIPTLIEIDISKSKRRMREQVLEAIDREGAAQGTLDCVAFFCHGWKTGIQLGFSSRHVNLLATRLRPYAPSNLALPIYACSTARDDDGEFIDDTEQDEIGGDGGFADEMRDALCAEAYAVHCRVLAHVTAGHTTVNPWVRFFDGAGMPYGGTGGYWVIRPHGPLWGRWIRWLRAADNRFRLPFLGVEEIRAEVVATD